MSPERNFSFQNGNLSVSVCHGAEEAEAQEPRTLSGVEDLNGGNQGAALGGGRLCRRRHSCAGAAPWDPSRCPAIGGSAHASVRLVAKWVFAKAARSEPSPSVRFLCHGVQYCTNTEIMHYLSIIC
jgi:hypothetical protein